MTDPADRHLEERLHALARGLPVPVVPTDEDVRRGRRRLLRMRLAVAGATTGTLAVVLGITSLTAGDPTASEVPPIDRPPSTSLPASPDSSPADRDGNDVGNRSTSSGGSKVGQPESDPSTVDNDTDVAGRVPGNVAAGAGADATHATTASDTDTDTDAATGGGGATPGHHPTHGPSHGPTSDPSSDPTDSASTAVPTETPSSSPTETPTSTPTSTATATPTSTPTVPPTDGDKVRVHRVLRYYNDVLAERLDPDRTSLRPYDRTQDTRTTRRSGGVLFALGSTYRWADGGSTAGLGITVASGWDQVAWECGASYSDWHCRAAGGAELATHDHLRQVAVAHADGQVVVLTADRSVDSADDELVAAATDERLTLPGVAPVSPPVIDSEAFASAGVAALVRTGESFDRTSIDRSPEVRGTWTVAGTLRGTLSWSAKPTYSGARWECLRSYRTCEEVVIDPLGTTVHLAKLRKRVGGGWVIQFDGPAYGVRVYSSDRTFPKKRAYAFVTQNAWQPSR